jgi:hypothetical protein
MNPHIAYSAWNVLMLLDSQQDTQSVRNVTMRRVRATTVPVKKQEVLHTLSVCL